MTTGRAQERGHTLIELMVVATLLGVLGIVFGLAGRYMSGETVRRRLRARVASELRMAVEFLREDLARAAKVSPRDGGGLLIFREAPIDGVEDPAAWVADDPVEYVAKDGRLYRLDPAGLQATVVARHVSTFEAEQPDGLQTRLHIGMGEELQERNVTLIWEP